jgi:hypothetical protein
VGDPLSEIEMPVVGKSFYTLCKKCDAERYHTVLALTKTASAKIKCQVCGSQKTWKAPTAKSAVAKSTAPRGAAASAKARSEAAKSAAHSAEYEKMAQTLAAAVEASYSMKAKFDKNTQLKHPLFGLGYVRSVQSEKIEVVFADQVRLLVHNRK